MNPLPNGDSGTASVPLYVAGREVAAYVVRADLPLAFSPRPYLHPVRTLRGTEVTEAQPPSHRYHLGLSIAIPDISGHNFWGGRTYLPGRGPTWIDNQGSQRHVRWEHRGPDGLVEHLRWTAQDGTALLTERRSIDVRALDTDSWALDFGFAFTSVSPLPLTVRSPALDGRLGAGYGGYFWRAPSTTRQVQVRTPDATGADAVHGAPASWLSVTGMAAGDRPWTLVFVPADEPTAEDPWFVRTRDYLGVGSALAWHEPLTIAPGAAVCRRLVTVVADGALPADRTAALAAAATEAAS